MLTANKINQFKQKYRDYPVQSLRDECDRAEEEIRSLEEDLKAGRLDSAMEQRLENRMDFVEYCRRPADDSRDADGRLNTPGSYDEPSTGASDGFKSTGEFLQAVIRSGIQGQVADQRLSYAPAENRASGLGESIPSEGGFLVNTDFASEVLKRLHNTSLVYDRARKIPISGASNGLKIPYVDETDRADGSRWGGIQMYWTAEAVSKTAAKPKFGQIEMSLKKLAGICYLTDELIQDAAALAAIVTDGYTEELGFKLDDGCINGTGAGQMAGILNANCLVTVAKEGGQVLKTIYFDNIIKMWSQMWSASKRNAVWFVNSSCLPEMMTMTIPVGTGGIPVWIPANSAQGQPYSTLFGRPVIEVEQCATLGTVGDIILADMSQYIAITKGGLQVAESIHVRFIQDESILRFVFRTDGQPGWPASLTPYKDASTSLPVSPFVALATRA